MAYKLIAKQTVFSNFEDIAQDMINNYSDTFPDFTTLWQFYLSVPLNSVPAERGFSQQNLQKNKMRNRLSEERLDQLMRISINGQRYDEFDFQGSSKRFREIRERRL